MEPVTRSAPGKIILFGEHAVVYGRPALAVPVFQVQAQATVEPRSGGRIRLVAQDVERSVWLDQAGANDPLAKIVRLTLARVGVSSSTGFTVTLHSTIPIARGLGSGAALAVATARALAAYWEQPLDAAAISALAYEVEKLHHGTPSGIDNTVIAMERPILYRNRTAWQDLQVAQPFLIAVADTGVSSPTRLTVGDVRRAWEAEPRRMDGYFDAIAGVVEQAREAIENGRVAELGPLMDENHELLCAIGVSAETDASLCQAARRAGALGAKLSGGGRGGNIIALIDDDRRGQIKDALYSAGAKNVIVTEVR